MCWEELRAYDVMTNDETAVHGIDSKKRLALHACHVL